MSIASFTDKDPSKLCQKLKPNIKDRFMQAIENSKSSKKIIDDCDVEGKMKQWQEK